MTNLTNHPAEHRTDRNPDAGPAAGTHPGRRLLWLGPIGIIAAIGLSVAEWIVVRGPDNDGTVLQALLALTMTVPVALARRWPVPAAAAVAIAALINGLVFPDLVRCAGAFPAVLYIAFAVGAWSRTGGRSWAWPVAGLALSLGAVVAQYLWDPALQAGGAGFLAFGPGLAALCWAAGVGWSVLVRRRGGRPAAVAEAV
jgi:hypothetical protein